MKPRVHPSPGSPPRKVVQDFAAFGAPKNVSVFGTAVASTPFSLAGGKAAFGGMRNPGGRGIFDPEEDEEEEDDGRQKVELRDDSITLDQVRRMVSPLWPLNISSNVIDRCSTIYHRLDELLYRVHGGAVHAFDLLHVFSGQVLPSSSSLFACISLFQVPAFCS